MGIHGKAFLCAVLALLLCALACAAVAEPEGDWTTPGSIVRFGTLEQDNSFDNGAEPLEWVVLHSDGEKSLIMTRDVVLIYRYGIFYVQPRFQNCDLKVFLNEAFDESPLEEVFIDVEARIDVLCIDLNHASTLGSIGLSGPCKLDF